MRIVTVLGAGLGAALMAGVSMAHADAPDAVSDAEPIGEVAEAATPVGTTCRASCAVSYAALCLRVQQICAVSTVVTLGSAAIPCGTAVAVTCLTSAAVAVICADRCPP